MVEKTINVPLDERSYDIFIGSDLATFIEEWLMRVYGEKKVFVVIDEKVDSQFEIERKKIFANMAHDVLQLTAGEEKKNHETTEMIYQFLLDGDCDRESLIVSFGGGVTGDIVGFCASTFMRGVDYVQIPTTLLAQVDSSVGGKTGINFRDAKNVIGAFFQPRAVFIDTRYLSTLEDRDFLSGLAEVLKVGFIGDKAIVDMLRGKTISDIRSYEPGLIDLIARSLQFKVGIVREDEKEGGLRKVLNFGHTLGHGIEEATSYTLLLHGEAVATGMAIESQISLMVGACAEETRNVLIGLLEDFGYEILPENVDYSKVISLLIRDKKRSQDKVVTPILTGIGQCKIREFSLKDYEKFAAESLNFLKSFKEVKLSSKLSLDIVDDLEVLESTGRFNDAESLISKVLEKDPDNERMNLILARLYLRQGKQSAAKGILDELLRINPDNRDAKALQRELEESREVYLPDDERVAPVTFPEDTVIEIGDDVYRIEGVSDEEEVSREEEGEEVFEEEMLAGRPALADPIHVASEPEENADEEIPIYSVAMAEVLLKEGKRDKSLEILDKILHDEPDNESAAKLKNEILTHEERKKVLGRYTLILERFLEKITEAYT